MKLLEIKLPNYRVDVEPDSQALGAEIDNVLKENFTDKEVVIRGIASSEHLNMSADALINKIQQTGTDRYDPDRTGDRYENVENKLIDLFGFPVTLSKTSKVGEDMIFGFYHSAIGIHGKPMRIDVVIIYDAHKLEEVPHKYAGGDYIKRDGFIFKDPERKVDAVLGVLKIS